MTDRELLELAAKAAGMKCRWWKVKEWEPTSYASGAMRGRMFKGCKDVFGTHHSKPWDPLTDDGDALRLAVKLGITIGIEYGRKYAHASGLVEKPIDGDLYSATRRAIVRAAAEIGKGL